MIENQHKPEFEEWVNENASESRPKLVKLGIIDHNLCPIKKEHLMNPEVDFSYRVWASAKKCQRELFLYQPDVVVFQMEEIVERDDVNSEATLENLIKFFQANSFEPYIIVFGCKQPTEELKNGLGYTKMMAYPDDIFINAIVGMVKSFNAKKNNELQASNVARYVPGKEEQVSTFLIEHEIKILRISEFDIDFEIERDLMPGTFFKMASPAKMIVRIMPQLESSPYFKQKHMHYGVFHSMDNDEKKTLRQYIQQKKD